MDDKKISELPIYDGSGDDSENYLAIVVDENGTFVSRRIQEKKLYDNSKLGLFEIGQGEKSIQVTFSDNSAEGDFSIVLNGEENVTKSGFEIVGGRFAEIINPNDSNGWDDNDILFHLGGGTAENQRGDVVQLWKDGRLFLNKLDKTKITQDATGKIVITKEWILDELEEREKIEEWTIDLEDEPEFEIRASYNLRISNPETIYKKSGSDTFDIEVNESSYTLGNLITKGDKIKFSTDGNVVVKIDLLKA